MSASWHVRPVTSADYTALRLLLPQAVHFGAAVLAWVAEDELARVIGAGAMSLRMRKSPAPGPRVIVHVVPPRRRLGVATAILNAIGAAAQSRKAEALYAWDQIEPGGPEHQCWQMLGFTQGVVAEQAWTSMTDGFEEFQLLYERLLQRGRIPPEAEVVRISEANPWQIAELHVTELGSVRADVLRQLRGEGGIRLDPELSCALVLEGKVLGFILVERQPVDSAAVFVHATVVHPELRRGWANLHMRYHFARRCLEAGVTSMVYQSFDQHPDTRSFNRKWGEIPKNLIQPYRLLPKRQSAD